jgi:hypothetical protein
MEERVGERRIAKSLNLSDEECQQYDIEPSSEPLVYDLCKVFNRCKVLKLICRRGR